MKRTCKVLVVAHSYVHVLNTSHLSATICMNEPLYTKFQASCVVLSVILMVIVTETLDTLYRKLTYRARTTQIFSLPLRLEATL